MKKRFTDEQIINKLRQAERLQSEGYVVEELSKKLGVTTQTYYRWKKKFGTSSKSEIKRLRSLEKENARLKKLLAESQLDNSILKEVIEGKY